MPYSPLKIELIDTGTQNNVWGATTNTNLGTAIEQAIGGKADVTMSSTNVTLTLTDTNAAQDARALYLDLTGTPGGAATLNVPAVQKAYIVRNGTTGGFAVTVKVTGQTGVSVPNGATMHLYNNGTDVVNAVTNLPAGTTLNNVALSTGPYNLATQVTGVLATVNGGTGLSALGTGVVSWLSSPTSGNLSAALIDKTGVLAGQGLAVFNRSPTITGLFETSSALGSGSGTRTINLNNGNFFTNTVTGNSTFAVSNVPSSGTVGSFIIEITNGGSATITWFAGVTWAGGVAPVLNASGTDVLGFYTLNGGSTWRGLVLAYDIKAP